MIQPFQCTSWITVLFTALTISGCQSAPSFMHQNLSSARSDDVISLRDSVEPVITFFNDHRGKPRVVVIVSSTCAACIFGAQAVNESVVEAFPDEEISVSVVWIDMLPTDGESAAIQLATIFKDSRVRQFHDPNRKLGWMISKQLLFRDAGPAWDIYLFYDRDAVWKDSPPDPIDWRDQLSGGRRADASRFHTGQKLKSELKELTHAAIAR